MKITIQVDIERQNEEETEVIKMSYESLKTFCIILTREALIKLDYVSITNTK